MAHFNRDFDVSVVIPLYNHARYIGAAIDSVLAQTLPAREIIVIDDGSSDGGIEIARERLAAHPRAIIVGQDNAGAHNAINRGIGMATSRYIAILNSDDLFDPLKLERCAQLWRKQKHFDLVFGDVALIDDDGEAVIDGPTVDWLSRSREFLERCGRLDLALANENFAVTTSNFVFTRDIWERVGGFQALRYCHDLDFIFSALREGHVLYDADVQHIRYRVHAANTIKEYVNRVRVECACVLACALDGGISMGPVDACDESTVALFEEAMASKQLDNLVPFLSARLATLGGVRATFYDWAINDPDVNAILLRKVEGMLATPEHARKEARELYRAGTGGQGLKSEACDPARERNAAFRAHIAQARGVEPKSKPSKIEGLPSPIVVELSAFDRGGLEKVVLDTSVVLRKEGIESVIVSCGKVGHLGEIARNQGFTVYELSDTDPLAHYRKILKDHGVKLAISHFSRTGYPVFRELGISNITFIHNVYAFLAGEALDNFIKDDRFVDRYISVSPKASDYAVERFGIDREKICTIPNGLVIDEHIERALTSTHIIRRDLGIDEDDFVFLNVASYNLHKGHYLMADAMRMLLRKTDKVRILCIGNTIVPHHVDQLREHIEAIGISRHMLLPGYFSDVAPFHAISDAFLLPSFIEGWSIAMNEAMFFGKPMILSDTGGSSEVIIDNDIGILLPNEYGAVGNLHSELLDDLAYNRRNFRTSAFLARAMLDFSQSPDRWRTAGLKGFQRVIDNYNFVDVVRSYLPIFKSAIAGKPEPARRER